MKNKYEKIFYIGSTNFAMLLILVVLEPSLKINKCRSHKQKGSP